jgi:mRNA interferase RelE/StbE
VTAPGQYALEFRPAAARELGKLAQDVQRRIRTATEALRVNPRPSGSIKLTNSNDRWRIRVGNYRVIYTIVDKTLVVTVIEIGHRREIHRSR